MLSKQSKIKLLNDNEVINALDALPRHPTKVWEKRNRLDIKGVIVHQSVSDGSMFSVAKYHITPSKDKDGDGIIESWERNHISDTGCPAICYHFGIVEDGTVYLMNIPEDITWHAKNFNSTHLGVVVFGDFNGITWKGTRDPSMAQTNNLIKLLNYIQLKFLKENNIPKDKFLGHCEIDKINKENCPGTVIMEKLNMWRLA